MTRCRMLVLSAVLWLAAPSSLVVASSVQAPSGGRGWWAREVGDEICVSDRGGETLACWPRALGRITDLRETVRGWIAAGDGPGTGGRDLLLLRDRGDGLESLAPPPAVGVPRGSPQLVTDDARLLGLVWLAGTTQAELEVRAAEWLGDDWGPAITVSPVGPGSQVAPTVTVLDDGRWLLLWTAFDGHDDETVWSLYDRGHWSAPSPVHEDNTTPDIVPTLVATERGAIAAWSWLDGRDYRLRTAFFSGSSWRLDPPSGGRGAVDARLLATSGTYLLTFQTVVPEQWVAYELDARGRVLHRAAVSGDAAGLPIVDLVGNGVAFRWPNGETVREALAVWELER